MVGDALNFDLGADLSEQGKVAAGGAVDPDPLIDERIGDAALAADDAVSWDVFRARFKTFGRRPAPFPLVSPASTWGSTCPTP